MWLVIASEATGGSGYRLLERLRVMAQVWTVWYARSKMLYGSDPTSRLETLGETWIAHRRIHIDLSGHVIPMFPATWWRMVGAHLGRVTAETMALVVHIITQ